MTVKTIIIDDEQHARNLISTYLSKHSQIEIIAECENGFEGLKAIQDHQPDLIFLDIQMPKITGFEMIELLDELPVIIFSTAYDEYAIKAFETSAVDYLLKPYGQDRFNQAVEKAITRIEEHKKQNSKESVKEIVDSHQEISGDIERIVVKSGKMIKVIPVDQIESIEAYDDYVNIYTPDGRFIKQQTMGYYEKNLNQKEFARVHRSYIIRLSKIVQLEPYGKDSKILIMKSGAKIKVSRSGLKVLKERLGI